ncbi:methyltransferase domain-containing protein [Nocardioides sp.]|uniref:class I SAM-dependent methyltransferase n=1 Tax=Nocardioides sp. TaxID=35761 RepID=UPI002633A782|nr:methyltransferase domain-containing protein [Nocardioides sp.]
MTEPDGSTARPEYTARLKKLSGARWKQHLDVQAPYRWNLQRILGDRRTLDVGCGLGRNLTSLSEDSVGVDHNPSSVRACLDAGFNAMTVDSFLDSDPDALGSFDGLLAAHLVEHLPAGHAARILAPYFAYLNAGALVVLICPQERGFASDETHTVFTDHSALAALVADLGLSLVKQYSFPFARAAGRIFTYNEFVTVASV